LTRDDRGSTPEQHGIIPRTDLGMSLERLGLEIGKLPTLKIVPVESIMLHEDADPGRLDRLKARIKAAGVIRNPVVAASDHGAASHVLLDGVNRLEALRWLGAKHILLQEVDLDDEHLVLSVWHHAIEGLDIAMMLGAVEPPARVTEVPMEFTDHGDLVPRLENDAACCLVSPERRGWIVTADGSPEARLDVIARLARQTQQAANRDRVSYTNLHDLTANYAGFSALICYRGFSKREVLNLALSGKRFPSGITRFSVPKRALEFRMSVSFLREPGSLESKQAELHRMILSKIRSKRIRFYEEPTFCFDD
jgi:hypothetical protein